MYDVKFLSDKYSREPMFAFVFEGVLFEFTYAKPQFAPLFALPPSKRPRGDTTFLFTIFQRGVRSDLAPRLRLNHATHLAGLRRLAYIAKPRADVRKRIRGRIIRVHIRKAAIRTIKRRTAEQKAPR